MSSFSCKSMGLFGTVIEVFDRSSRQEPIREGDSFADTESVLSSIFRHAEKFSFYSLTQCGHIVQSLWVVADNLDDLTNLHFDHRFASLMDGNRTEEPQ